QGSIDRKRAARSGQRPDARRERPPRWQLSRGGERQVQPGRRHAGGLDPLHRIQRRRRDRYQGGGRNQAVLEQVDDRGVRLRIDAEIVGGDHESAIHGRLTCAGTDFYDTPPAREASLVITLTTVSRARSGSAGSYLMKDPHSAGLLGRREPLG